MWWSLFCFHGRFPPIVRNLAPADAPGAAAHLVSGCVRVYCVNLCERTCVRALLCVNVVEFVLFSWPLSSNRGQSCACRRSWICCTSGIWVCVCVCEEGISPVG